MSTQVVTPTKCKLCDHVFSEDLMRSAALIGSNPQAKLQQVQAMIQPLMKHLQKKHPEHIQRAQIAGGALAGYLTIDGAFDMDTDTKARLGNDYTRWNIRRILARPETIVSNERIRERAAEVWGSVDWKTRGTAESDKVFEGFVSLLCEMRDTIEERDRYKPGQVDQSNGQPN